MKKFTGISGKIFAGVLALALVAGMFGPETEVMAATDAGDEAVVEAIEPRTTYVHSYSVSYGKTDKSKFRNDDTMNDVTIYINGRPNSGKVLLEVYDNANYSGTPKAKKTYWAEESGMQLVVTVPKNTTYYIMVSTDSTSTITGKVTIVS